MSSVEQAADQIANDWAEVRQIWLDDNAAGVERSSIKPLLDILQSAQRLNAENLARAEELAAKAAEIPQD